MFTADILPDLLAEAEEYIIQNDRELYAPFLQIIEEHLSADAPRIGAPIGAGAHIDTYPYFGSHAPADMYPGFVLGGQVATDIILGAQKSSAGYFWTIYCHEFDAWPRVKRLADALSRAKSAHVPAREVVLQTVLRHREYTINVGPRPLCRIVAIADRKIMAGVSTVNTPSTYTGYFGTQIKCMPPIVQLISTYRTLCSPSKVGEWESAIISEAKLADMILGKKEDIPGTSNHTASHDPFGALNSTLRAIAKLPGAILGGEHAARMLCPGPTPRGRLQLVGNANLVQHAETLLKRTGAVKTTTYSTLPDDWQMQKYTLSVDGRPLVDIYNTCDYELIPTMRINKTTCLGHWALLRFMFIDMWTAQILGLESRVEHITGAIQDIREVTLETLRKDPEKIFTMDYVGASLNEVVAKKKLASTERLPPYYPAKQAH